ncbi:MAG: hypothetical protein IIB44_01170 [Candidatus Marinimicrobia bacterium]|nr:hypothetical protein [Candidatus Neomarinimicrobiota bacterium]MCH8069057.1 hypothetical protein [Candidatus Neomarinimicrobiota bacterium]
MIRKYSIRKIIGYLLISPWIVLGQVDYISEIQTLIFDSTWMEPGMHEILWWGEDRSNQYVSSGIYILRIRQGSTTFSKKLVLIK